MMDRIKTSDFLLTLFSTTQTAQKHPKDVLNMSSTRHSNVLKMSGNIV